MHHIIIKEHSEHCNIEHKLYLDRWEKSSEIERQFLISPQLIRINDWERNLLFLGNDFYLLEYHSCLRYDYSFSSKYDFIVYLCKRIWKEFHPNLLINVNRSRVIDDDFREYRLRGKALETTYSQINYIYSDSADKTYCIESEGNIFDLIQDEDEFSKNVDSARKYLSKRGKEYEYLKDELEELILYNDIPLPDEYEIYKTLEHAVKTIKRKIKKRLI